MPSTVSSAVTATHSSPDARPGVIIVRERAYVGFDCRDSQQLSRDECLHLIAKVCVGRIVLTAQGLPAIQPVNYMMDGDTVLIPTPPVSWLALKADNTIVAFQVDDIDAHSQCGWHVNAVGPAKLVNNQHRINRPNRMTPPPWGPPDTAQFIRVQLSIVHGQHITAHVTM